MDERRIESVHFIGIGGVGMSGIALVAHDQGIRVTGSDIKDSRYTKQLREAGEALVQAADSAGALGLTLQAGATRASMKAPCSCARRTCLSATRISAIGSFSAMMAAPRVP